MQGWSFQGYSVVGSNSKESHGGGGVGRLVAPRGGEVGGACVAEQPPEQRRRPGERVRLVAPGGRAERQAPGGLTASLVASPLHPAPDN